MSQRERGGVIVEHTHLRYCSVSRPDPACKCLPANQLLPAVSPETECNTAKACNNSQHPAAGIGVTNNGGDNPPFPLV